MRTAFLTFFLIITLQIPLNAQQLPKTYSIQELRAIFRDTTYSEKTLLEFQKTMVNLRVKPQLHEDVPGEVLSWYTLNGEFSIHKTYLIQKDKVAEVKTIPTDEKFLAKLNSYVPEQSKFSYSYDLWSFAFVEKKLEEGYYLIKATAKSFNSHPDIPNDDILLYDLEYKTKDFKEFRLVRLKDIHTEKWIDVEDY